MSKMREPITHQAPRDGELGGEVLAAVAALKNAEPLTLPPLFEALDPDALNRLFAHPSNGTLRLTFEYADCEIEITDDSRITVAEIS